MSPLAFAWRSWARQPARALLGVAGVAVVGALLFDMLLLSRGLTVSFRDLLDGAGFDVRVTVGAWVPSRGPAIADGRAVLERLRALDEVEDATALRFGKAEIVHPGGGYTPANFMGVSGPTRRNWTVLQGEDLAEQSGSGMPAILLNQRLARWARVSPGDVLRLRGACEPAGAVMPATELRVAGIIELRFEAHQGDSRVSAVGRSQLCRLPLGYPCGDLRESRRPPDWRGMHFSRVAEMRVK